MHTNVYPNLAALPESYMALFDESANICFSYSRGWFENLINTVLEDGVDLRLYGVEDESPGGVARGLLMARTPASKRGSILRTRQTSSRTLSGLTAFQTYLYAILIRQSDPELNSIVRVLAQTLREDRPNWHLIDLAALDAESPVYSAILDEFRNEGFVVKPYVNYLNRYQDTENRTYDDYLSERPKGARKSIKEYTRLERRLSESGRTRSELFDSTAEIDRAIADYEQVARNSWKPPEAHPEFMRGFIRYCAASGWLRLQIVYVDDEPAATVLAVVTGGRAVIFRNDYNVNFRKLSVGSIAILQALRHLLDADKVRELDYGRDDEPYKHIWMSDIRQRMGVLVFCPRTFGGLVALCQHSAVQLKDETIRRLKPALQAVASKVRGRS